MTITTDRGNSCDVIYIDNPIQDADALLMSMEDGRRLCEIAADFDGLQRIERRDANQGDKVFEGYSKLSEIRRLPDGDKVVIVMRREG